MRYGACSDLTLGRRIITVASVLSTPTIILWDVASRARIATLQAHAGTVDMLAFSPDGRTLASGSYDGTITWWDITSRTPLATLTGHTARITSLIFSPDRHTLISASADHTIIAWGTDTQQVQTRICATIGHNLTRNEWSQFTPGTSYHKTCG
jgi:WD40 repeat protein